VAGSAAELPWDEGLPPNDPETAFVCDRPSAEIIGYHRNQCAHTDAVLAVTYPGSGVSHSERVTRIELALSAWEVGVAALPPPADWPSCGSVGTLPVRDRDCPRWLLRSGT